MTMLRTNDSFLLYVQKIYEQQQRKENIIIKHYNPGDRIFLQNEPTSKIMLIKEGITKCYFTENNGKEYILEFLGQGEVIGEIEYFQKIPCLCTIEALTTVTTYAFSIPYFQKLIQEDLQLNNLLLFAFSERIVNTASRASYQQLYTVEHNLNKLLEIQKQQNISISKDDLAAYLGVSIRTLNRGLKNLKP
ncbi:Crp/Fnr family transcriptional regulator [Flavobacterium sp. HSC-61S13]|uniref:Crp/Fnr family transcriptional regulator n=1 Tax=Flavobacterium sp. HSC-61S13 TaxID=2910963 RepID=UPI0035321251|nr:CRP-like cAMP-binding protein [Flavobacterium sp. HSC-61S13]